MDSMQSLIRARVGIPAKAHLRLVKDEDPLFGVPKTSTPVTNICPECKGAGYKRANVPYGHPNFGKALECECRRAEKQKKQQAKLIETSGILSLGLFEDATLDSFDKSLPGTVEAYRRSASFAEKPDGWLVLVGPVGCGKTHLAVAVARKRIEAGDTVLVQTAPDLLDHLRATFGPGSEVQYSQLFEDMRNVDVLVLDDFGAHNGTSWAEEKLFQLLNYRYNARKSTIITSNGLEDANPRLKSRMHDGRLGKPVYMHDALDYRTQGGDYE